MKELSDFGFKCDLKRMCCIYSRTTLKRTNYEWVDKSIELRLEDYVTVNWKMEWAMRKLPENFAKLYDFVTLSCP